MKKSPENKPKIKQKLHPDMEAVKWKPGQSGNPGGRPAKKPMTEIYERLMQEPEFQASFEASIRAMVKSGRMVGQLQIKEMTDRIEGKVTQKIEADVSVMSLADAIAAARKRAGR
jgi:hypothetical protein